MNHGAIETEYGGCRFRSRLEARWAVFFDTLRIRWKYETEGFEARGERYLPDFFLPDSADWVEVKGDPDGLEKARLSKILGDDSPLPGFAAGDTDLLVLGDLPKESEGTVLHQALTRKGMVGRVGDLKSQWFFFSPSGQTWVPRSVQPSIALSLFGRGIGSGVDVLDCGDAWQVRHEVLPTPLRFGPVFEAYRAARHARFEHGEHGR